MSADNRTNLASQVYSISLGGKLAIGIVNLVFFVVVLFAIVLVAKNRSLNVTSKILLGNLMVAHLGYWLHGLIRIGVTRFIYGMDCMIMIYIIVAQLYGSVFAVAAVAADRFLVTRFPFRYTEVKCRYVLAVVITLWATTPLFSLATFYGGVDESNACQPWFSIPVKGLVLFGVTVAFSSTSVLAMCFYVGKEVLRHLRSINDASFSCNRDQKQKRRGVLMQLDTTLTFGLIALSHCLMVYPLIIIFPLMSTGRYDEKTMSNLMVIFGTCARVSDPFIYILRTKLKSCICCTCCKCFPSVQPSFSSKETDSTEDRQIPIRLETI